MRYTLEEAIMNLFWMGKMDLRFEKDELMKQRVLNGTNKVLVSSPGYLLNKLYISFGGASSHIWISNS